MAKRQRQTFQKREKELKRLQKQESKRARRQAKKLDAGEPGEERGGSDAAAAEAGATLARPM